MGNWGSSDDEGADQKDPRTPREDELRTERTKDDPVPEKEGPERMEDKELEDKVGNTTRAGRNDEKDQEGKGRLDQASRGNPR